MRAPHRRVDEVADAGRKNAQHERLRHEQQDAGVTGEPLSDVANLVRSEIVTRGYMLNARKCHKFNQGLEQDKRHAGVNFSEACNFEDGGSYPTAFADARSQPAALTCAAENPAALMVDQSHPAALHKAASKPAALRDGASSPSTAGLPRAASTAFTARTLRIVNKPGVRAAEDAMSGREDEAPPALAAIYPSPRQRAAAGALDAASALGD
jgi:hypothetical protein